MIVCTAIQFHTECSSESIMLLIKRMSNRFASIQWKPVVLRIQIHYATCSHECSSMPIIGRLVLENSFGTKTSISQQVRFAVKQWKVVLHSSFQQLQPKTKIYFISLVGSEVWTCSAWVGTRTNDYTPLACSKLRFWIFVWLVFRDNSFECRSDYQMASSVTNSASSVLSTMLLTQWTRTYSIISDKP